MNDCDSLVLCVSERSLNIILNSLWKVEEMRTRLYTEHEGEEYTLASEAEFEQFRLWLSQVHNELGSWVMCNEYLERIAIALEGIQTDHHFIAENTEELVTLESVLDGVETVLGIGHPVIAIIDIIRSITPSLDIKVNVTTWVLALWEYIGWKLPILTWMGGMLTVGTVQAAATVGNAVQLLMANFMAGTQNLAGIVGWVTGLWGGSNSLVSWLATIFGWFTRDEDGGEGGDDPDNDPNIRTEVNVANTLINNNAFSCTPEIHVDGCSGGCGCGSGSGVFVPNPGGAGDSPPTSIPPAGFPGTFPDQPTYDTYKCKAANVIVLNLAELLYQLGQFQNIDLSQYALWPDAQAWIADKIRQAGALGTPFTSQAANWLATKIMGFVWPWPSILGVELEIFEDVRLELLDEREESVCDLFNASHTGGARDALETRIDGYIDATSYTSEVKALAKEMYKAVLTNDLLNGLFEKDSKINTYSDVSAIDCDLCGGGGYTIVVGEAQSTAGANPFTVQLIYSTFSGICGPTLKRGILVNFHASVTINSITGVEGEGLCTGLSHKYFLYPDEGGAGGATYSSASPPVDFAGVRSLAIITGSGGSPEATITFTLD